MSNFGKGVAIGTALFFLALLVYVVPLARRSGQRLEECESRGGTMVRTAHGRVCAKLERL